MSFKELCPECRKTGRCWFKDAAYEIATSVPIKENKSEQLFEACVALQEIATGRIMAREKMCPNLNDVDPDYPGKNLL
jgi:hypothetical protein